MIVGSGDQLRGWVQTDSNRSIMQKAGVKLYSAITIKNKEGLIGKWLRFWTGKTCLTVQVGQDSWLVNKRSLEKYLARNPVHLKNIDIFEGAKKNIRKVNKQVIYENASTLVNNIKIQWEKEERAAMRNLLNPECDLGEAIEKSYPFLSEIPLKKDKDFIASIREETEGIVASRVGCMIDIMEKQKVVKKGEIPIPERIEEFQIGFGTEWEKQLLKSTCSFKTKEQVKMIAKGLGFQHVSKNFAKDSDSYFNSFMDAWNKNENKADLLKELKPLYTTKKSNVREAIKTALNDELKDEQSIQSNN